MNSRRWIGTVLITLVVVAILAAGGYALYRYGYIRGRAATINSEGLMPHHYEGMPFPGGMHEFPRGPYGGPHNDGMPGQFQDRADFFGEMQGHPYDRRFFPQMGGGRPLYYGSFSIFQFLLKILLYGLIVWLVIKFVRLFSGGKSWQLSFNSIDPDEPEEVSKPGGRAKKS